MPRVLHLAHHYPPIGGVVGRNLDLSRYLPEFDFSPTAVTGPEDATGRWAPEDLDLVARTNGVKVIRVPGPVPDGGPGRRSSIARWLELTPPRVRWWIDGAVEVGQSLEGRFDVILANLLPLETATAAAMLSRCLGIPWVADLDDPWALDEMRVAPTRLNYEIDLRKMRRGLSTASAFIMSCPEATSRLRKRIPELADRPITAVPHGFNRHDFDGQPPRRDDDRFRIVHTGSLHTQLGLDHRASARTRRLLGGTSLDVDIYTRSHVYLLRAIEQLAEREPGLASRIEVHLVGQHTPADLAVAARHPYVRTYGHRPHPETIALARSADLLFLPMHDLPPGQRAGIVPCKTYEYLATERPVLAAVPDGDCRDLVARFSRAAVVRPADVDGMTSALSEHLRGPAPPVAAAERLDGDILRPYERRAMTERIAGVLRSVIDAPARAAVRRPGAKLPGRSRRSPLRSRRPPSRI